MSWWDWMKARWAARKTSRRQSNTAQLGGNLYSPCTDSAAYTDASPRGGRLGAEDVMPEGGDSTRFPSAEAPRPEMPPRSSRGVG